MQSLGHIPIIWPVIVLMAVLACASFVFGRRKAEQLLAADSSVRLNSRINFHGYYTAMWALGPMILTVFLAGLMIEPLARMLVSGELPDGFGALDPAERSNYIDRVVEFVRVGGAAETGDAMFDAIASRFTAILGQIRLGVLALVAVVGLIGSAFAWLRLAPDFRARRRVESGVQVVLFLCAAVAVVTTVGIVLSLVFETLRFFGMVNPLSFLFGLDWNAQTNDSFGAVPLFFGTFVISLIAMMVAVPVGLYSAIFLSEYASPRVRAWVKPILEVLAGIPTVVYGFFALLLVAPLVRMAAMGVNDLLMLLPFINAPVLDAQPTSALAAGLVMGVMIIPFVSSLSDDVINAVPQSLRDGSYALGSTKSETIKQVVLPAALPGVIAAIMLAVSRAIGETMIVVMAAGQRAQITPDVTSDITTITATIVALLTGDTEFDSPKTLSAFALGFMLFVVTLIFNLIALRVVQKFREKYD